MTCRACNRPLTCDCYDLHAADIIPRSPLAGAGVTPPDASPESLAHLHEAGDTTRAFISPNSLSISVSYELCQRGTVG